MTEAHDDYAEPVDIAEVHALPVGTRIPGSTNLYLTAGHTQIIKRTARGDEPWLDWAPELIAWWPGTGPHERIYRVQVGDTIADIRSDEFSSAEVWEEFPRAAGHDTKAVREALAGIVKMQRRDMDPAPGVHTLGWHDLGDEHGPTYVTPGATFGPSGPVPVQVAVADAEPAAMPDPPKGEDAAAALRRSLSLLDVAPDRVTAPLMASTWLAPLVTRFGDHMPRFVPWMWSDGRSGVFGVLKSSLAALSQAHSGLGYGASEDALMPAADATVPAVTGVLGTRQSGLLWLDDYKPGEASAVAAKTQVLMETSIRAATNRQRRIKSQRIGGLATTLPCYAILAVTGESLPLFDSGSTHDRTFPWQVHQGDVRLDRLTEVQDHAEQLTEAGAVYLDWLARRGAALDNQLIGRFRALRAELRDHVTGRAAAHIAHMLCAAETLTACAVDHGALTEPDRAALLDRIRTGLITAHRGTADERTEDRTEVAWLELLRAVLASGDAYVVSGEGTRPARDAERLGWGVEHPRGRTVIGYALESGLALIPTAAERAVSALGTSTGRSIPIRGRQLRRLLARHGVITPAEPDSGGRHEHEHRERVGGGRAWCLRVPWEVFSDGPPDQSPPGPQSGPTGGTTGGPTGGPTEVVPRGPTWSHAVGPPKNDVSAGQQGWSHWSHVVPQKTPRFEKNTPTNTDTSEKTEENAVVRTPTPQNPTPAPASRAAGTVHAVGLSPETVYLAGPDGITTTDPGDAYRDMGTLLNAVLGWMPTGGTVVLDSDTPDLIGWPDYPMGTADFVAEYGEDFVPAAITDAAAAGWSCSLERWTDDEGRTHEAPMVRTWTTWTPADRDQRPSITTLVLPWCTSEVLRGGTHQMITADDDVTTAAMLLSEWRARMRTAYAYGTGSSAVRSVHAEYIGLGGQPSTRDADRQAHIDAGKKVGRPRRRPLMVMARREPGASIDIPAWHLREPNTQWVNTAAAAELADDHHVLKLDVSKQHASAMSHGLHALDRLGYVPEWPVIDNGGMYEVPAGTYRLPGGPYLAGPEPRHGDPDGPQWLPAPSVRFLISEGLLDDSEYPAYVPFGRDGQPLRDDKGAPARGVPVFDGYAARVKGTLAEIPADTGDPEMARVLAAVRASYQEMAGMLRKGTPFVARPDWGNNVVALSRANLLRRVVRVWRATGAAHGGIWPLQIKADAVYYAAPGGTQTPEAATAWFTIDKRTERRADADTIPEKYAYRVWPLGTTYGTYSIEAWGTARQYRSGEL